MYNIKDKKKLEYFKSIVKGHTIKEIQKIYYDKFKEELSRNKVEGLKIRYKLYSGIDTKYKKGHKYEEHNLKPIGSERICNNGSNEFIKIKIGQPKKWVLKHRYIYEQHYGKIPEDKVIVFLDRNTKNCDIDNLELIDMKEHLLMSRMGLYSDDKEITKTGILIARLMNKNNELKDKEKKEMANLWRKLNKMNKSNYEISQATNIPEQKVKEIMEGKRQLPKDRIDEFVGVLQNNNKTEKSLKIHQVKQWYKETDLKARRKELGYRTQIDLAKEMNLHPSVICRLENKVEEKHISDNTLIRYYDFLNNDLNKVIDKKIIKSKLKVRNNTSVEEKREIKNTNWEEVLEWYNNFDLRKWLKDNKLSHREFAMELGYRSGTSITDLLNNKPKNGTKDLRNHRIAMTKAYLYFKKLNKKEEDIEVLDETDLYENKNIDLDKTCKVKIDYPEIELSTEEKIPIRPSSKEATIMRLEYELEEARKQIARYEKLIDMIIVEK